MLVEFKKFFVVLSEFGCKRAEVMGSYRKFTQVVLMASNIGSNMCKIIEKGLP